MLNNNYRINDYTFFDLVDPDDSVHNSLGYTCDNGDHFLNTDTSTLFFCSYGGGNPQIWNALAYKSDLAASIAAIPQANWTQSNSSSSDYIKNKPTTPLARSQSAQTRSFNTAYQISSTRDSLVNYSVDIATTLNLTTGQSGTVYLEIASDSGFTTNVQEISRIANGQTGTLTIGLGLNQNVTGSLNGYVPVGYYSRLRTQNNTSTPTFTFRSGQEVLL